MVRIACIGLLLCPLPAFALDIGGSMGHEVHIGDPTMGQSDTTEEKDSPMLASALNDPHANAADLGLASPGSPLGLPSFGKGQE